MHFNESPWFKQRYYSNGQWLDAGSRKVIEVHNPATGELVGTVPDISEEETNQAIEAAHAAFPMWSQKTGKERAAILRKWYNLMMANQEDLALIMTVEQGKPLIESRGEIAYAASFIEWFAEEAKRSYGDVIPAVKANQQLITLRQPIGVAAAVTPWNFPAAMITRKVGPALAAGCTMIVKPSSYTPFSALAMAALAEEAGVPAGVLNVVTGSASVIGKPLTTHPKIRKFSFTGSTETGKKLAATCTGTMKKISMELGGNAPFIVFDDADVEQAVAGAIASKFRNSGQTCVCANRIFVQAGIYDAFVEKLIKAVQDLKIGNGLAPGIQQGPLINEDAVAKVEALLKDAIAKGARVLQGGKRHSLGGTFFEPTIITDITSDMLISQEEIFGPVAAIERFDYEDEAISRANATPYGLASYFYSRDIGRIWRVAQALECGMVGINEGILSYEVAPFGGVKESGIGREGSYLGMEEYLEVKYLCMGY